MVLLSQSSLSKAFFSGVELITHCINMTPSTQVALGLVAWHWHGSQGMWLALLALVWAEDDMVLALVLAQTMAHY